MYNALNIAIKDLFGTNAMIDNTKNISGGCISHTYVVYITTGEKVFVKENSLKYLNMFHSEFAALELLKCAGGPVIPTPFSTFETADRAFILMEFIESGVKNRDFDERAGEALGNLHKNKKNRLYGLSFNNFIGTTPQDNFQNKSWPDFFAERRLLPQIKLAQKNSSLDITLERKLFKLIENIDTFIHQPEEGPSLLHGDLWSGNIMCDKNNNPVIFDPAVYYGDRETDIAMTTLFGGFSNRFYEAYNENYPLEKDFKSRTDIYNLYHILNHLNIFGRGYLSQVNSILNSYLK
ncbi:MAG: fructosamine kinase family protein [Deltaproteobacteria bacterium]|nr:fructosamine kinase family protein [Deltaproteobacteria bacterium]